MSKQASGTPRWDFRDLVHRDISLTELGWRGTWRVGQTVTALYPKAIKWLIQRRRPRPQELRELFESLGATYIKFGQFIASSPSVFPKEYVDEFQKLLDQTKPIDARRIRKIVEKDLGRPINEVFSAFDDQALASASVAQVHAATLISGEDVVVKVQKPGVQSVLTTDMNAAYLMLRLMELIIPNMDRDAIAGVVSEMYQAMREEGDFEKEAENLSVFRSFLQQSGFADTAHAPKPYPDVSGQKILVMERLYGKNITDPQALADGSAPQEALFQALNIWFASLMSCEFFHADLHSGNLLLLRDGRVGFIDFGMVGRIDPSIWQSVFGLFQGLSEENYGLIADAMIGVGLTRDKVDSEALTRDIEALFKDLDNLDAMDMNQLGDFDQMGANGDKVTQMMSKLGEIARQYGIRFPRAFTLLLKQFLYFDRYVDMLAPGTELFNDDRIDTLLPKLQ